MSEASFSSIMTGLSARPVARQLDQVWPAIFGQGSWPTRECLSVTLAQRGQSLYGQDFGLRFSQPPVFGKRRRRQLKQESPLAFATAQYQARYETQIFEYGAIPHRLQNWHDLMNAAIWLSFPLTKLELHRQALKLYQEERKGLHPDQLHLQTGRSRRLDHLTWLDEGGIILLVPAEEWDTASRQVANRNLAEKAQWLRHWQQPVLIFGHGVWEELLNGVTAIHVMTLLFPWKPQSVTWSADDLLLLDRELAAFLAASIDWSNPQEPFHKRVIGSLPLAEYRGIFAENTRQIDNGSSLMMP